MRGRGGGGGVGGGEGESSPAAVYGISYSNNRDHGRVVRSWVKITLG